MKKPKKEPKDDSLADLLDLDLNKTFKRVVGEPSINLNESLEETMNRFINSLPTHERKKDDNS